MNITFDAKTILNKLTIVWEFIKKYSHFIYFIVLACLVGYLVWHIDSLTRTEPDEEAVTSKFKTVQKIDQSTLSQIEQLKDQNVETKSLFEHARDNPFSE